MTFKQLLEEYKDTIKKTLYSNEKIDVEIFVNPNSKEKKEILQSKPHKGILQSKHHEGIYRAIMLSNGNLYTFLPQTELIHVDMLEILKKKNIINISKLYNWYAGEELNKFLCVSTQDFKNFFLAESYKLFVSRKDEIDKYKKLFSEKGLTLIKKNVKEA